MFVQAVPRAAVPPRSPSGTIIPVHARSADWAAWWTAPTHLLFPAGPAVPQGPRRATSNRALRRARIHIQWVVVLIVPDKRIRQSFTSRLLRSSKTKGQSESALFSFYFGASALLWWRDKLFGQLRSCAKEILLHLLDEELLSLRLPWLQAIFIEQHLGVLSPHLPGFGTHVFINFLPQFGVERGFIQAGQFTSKLCAFDDTGHGAIVTRVGRAAAPLVIVPVCPATSQSAHCRTGAARARGKREAPPSTL